MGNAHIPNRRLQAILQRVKEKQGMRRATLRLFLLRKRGTTTPRDPRPCPGRKRRHILKLAARQQFKKRCILVGCQKPFSRGMLTSFVKMSNGPQHLANYKLVLRGKGHAIDPSVEGGT